MTEDTGADTKHSGHVRRGAMRGLVLGASVYLLAYGAAYYETPREETQSNYLGWAAPMGTPSGQR